MSQLIEPFDAWFESDPSFFITTTHLETKICTMETEHRLEREEKRKEIQSLNMSIATLTTKVEELKNMLEHPPIQTTTDPSPSPSPSPIQTPSTSPRPIICAILEVIHQVITKPTPQAANVVHFISFQPNYLIIASGGVKLLAEIITDILGQVCGPSEIRCKENML
jgi:hypothetical protein